MSHLQERKETNCLNCNAKVHGKFCSVCGQENLEPAESAWHLITHFFNDITHFDGKFFSSLKYLVFKPGFLSTEYKRGRRASYLNPVRMYVFTSFLFFLVFFSVFHLDDMDFDEMADRRLNGKTMEQINKMPDDVFKEFAKEVDSSRTLNRAEIARYIDTSMSFSHKRISDFKSQAEYDSLLRKGSRKDGWVMQKLNRRMIELDKRFDGNSNKMMQTMLGNFMHRFPQMLFVSLPLFALFLKLIYWRSKEFYFVSHAIFSLHIYIFTFIILLVQIGISQLSEALHWEISDTVSFIVALVILFYEYKAMRNFYGQSRGKTIAKFLLLNFYLLILMTIIFSLFFIFSFLKG